MIRTIISSCLFLFTGSCLVGQDLHLIERDLVNEYQSMEPQPNKPPPPGDRNSPDWDSVFMNKLLHYTGTVPATLKYSFDSLGLFSKLPSGGIVSSDDSLVRIYSVRGKCIIQYKFESAVKSERLPPLPGPPGFMMNGYRVIDNIQNDKKTYYMAIYQYLRGEGVKFFAMGKNGLDSIPLVKMGKGKPTYSIIYIADNAPDNPDGYIYWDPIKQTLNVPVPNADKKLTGKYTAYKLNKNYFEEIEK